jgi:hypothetical protein
MGGVAGLESRCVSPLVFILRFIDVEAKSILARSCLVCCEGCQV